MDPTTIVRPGSAIGSAAAVASFLHLGDPAVSARVALATRSDGSWDELTYAQLDRRSGQVRGWLTANGIGAGARVGLLGDSGNDWVAAFFGILRCGAVVIPLDTRLTVDELGQIIDRSAPAAMVASRRLAGGTEQRQPVLELEDIAGLPDATGSDASGPMDELAVVVWTSGTTGTAKGVCLTYANLDYVVTASVAAQGVNADDRWLSVLSLNHMLELSCGLLSTLRCGATFCFAQSLMPREVVASMRERRVTRMMVVPLVLRLLHDELARESTVAGLVTALFSGGAALGQELLDAYGALGIPVYQGYGLTELAPAVSMNTATHNRPGSVGRPLAGTEVRVQDGEILVRSPGLMAGYWLDEEHTGAVIDDEGWFHTGDLGRVDADGYLYVTGRSKDLIVLDSGKKVQPEEVEVVLAASDLFAEVCVVGIHTARHGLASAEQVCAVVVPNEGVSVDEVTAEVHRRTVVLSGYKRPTVVEVWTDELPKTAKRSVRRAEVARLVGERRGEQ